MTSHAIVVPRGLWRCLPLCLLVTLLASATVARATPRGDINLDGAIGAPDVVLLQRHLAGDITLAGRQLVAADLAPVDGSAVEPDGSVDSGDLVVLLQIVAGSLSVSALSEPVLDTLPTSQGYNGLHVTGTAPTGSVVDVYVDGVKAGTATAAAGVFAVDVPLGASGAHEVFATRAMGAEASGPTGLQTVTYNDPGNTYTSATVASSGQTLIWYPRPSGQAYRFEGDVTIASGGELRIHAGAKVVFANDGGAPGRLLIDGTLNVEGELGNPVVFTAAGGSTTRGSWTTIQFRNGATGTVNHAQVSYAKRGFVVRLAGTDVTIQNSEVFGFLDIAGNGYGIGVFDQGKLTATGNVIHQGGWDGSACGQGDGYRQGWGVKIGDAHDDTLIEASEIACVEEGFFVEHSALKIHNNLVTQNVAGIVLNHGGDPEISQGNDIVSNRDTGIRLKNTYPGNTAENYPLPTITGNTISGNGVEGGTNKELQVWGWNEDGENLRVDAERNDWGTTDSAVIMSRIVDALDAAIGTDEGDKKAIIDFVPYVDDQGTAYLGNDLVWGIPTDGNGDGVAIVAGTYRGYRTTRVHTTSTVTVPAGVTFAFEKDADFEIAGFLDVYGTAQDPVVFESAESTPARGDWVGIYVDGVTVTATANLRHAQIRHAEVGVRGAFHSGISVWDSMIELFKDQATSSESAGIRSEGGIGYIERNTIRGDCALGTPYGTGLWFYFTTAGAFEIRDNTVECFDRGMYLVPSLNPTQFFTVVGNTIRDNTKGLVAERSLPLLTGNTITDNTIGIRLRNVPVLGAANARRNAIHQNGTNLELLDYASGGSEIELDFRQNYWGSTDANTIYGGLALAGAGSPPSGVVLFSEYLDGAPDPDGSLPPGVTQSTAQHATAPLEAVSAGAYAFSPRAPESFDVTVTLRGTADVTLWVCPDYQSACNSGSAVRTQTFAALVGSQAGTDHVLGWDGKADGGAYVADGVYAFAVRAADPVVSAIQDSYDPSAGTTKFLNFTGGFAGYAAAPIHSGGASPNAFENDLPGTTYDIGPFPGTATPGSRPLQWVYLTRLNGSQEDPNYFAGPQYVVPNESGRIVWDGRDPATAAFVEDSFTLRFHGRYVEKPNFVIVRDTVPEAYSATDPPALEIQTNPFRMRHSFSEVSEVSYRITRDANVRILLLPPGIYNPAAPEAVEVQPSTLQSALDGGQPKVHTFRWDNVNAADPGLARLETEGEWTVAIEVSDPADASLQSLYRGVLQLRR